LINKLTPGQDRRETSRIINMLKGRGIKVKVLKRKKTDTHRRAQFETQNGDILCKGEEGIIRYLSGSPKESA